MTIINFIDETAKVHPTATVWHFARVLAGVVIEENVSIGSGAEIGAGSIIGKGSRISADVFLPSHSVVGENCFLGPGARCADDRRPRANQPYTPEPPTICNGASIGMNATLLPGVVVGENAMVAAGAIVTRNVPSGVTVRCEPARERLGGLKRLHQEHGWYDARA
jgi:UDP-2-acetamido-3-amino-2,3-dideoxy-glucuronate N-acetyltransferase